MSDEQLSQLLSDLRESAKQLNEASDSINEIISSVEKQIIDSKVGLECWVRMSITDPAETCDNDYKVVDQVATELGFTKLEEGWGLAIRKVNYTTRGYEETNVEYGVSERLSRESREIRIDALERVPVLIKSLTLAATSKTQSIAKAKKLAKK